MKVLPKTIPAVGNCAFLLGCVCIDVLASYLPLESISKAVIAEFLQCAQKIKKSTMIETNWPDRWTTFASNERLRRLSSVRDVPKDDAGVFWLENIEHWSQEADLHVRANVPGHNLLIKFG